MELVRVNVPLMFLVVFTAAYLVTDVIARPNEPALSHTLHDDKECPRKPELIGNRKCLKKCRSNNDCRGRNKRCLCDDVCGKSCVKPTLRCETLKPIFNGKYEILPFNTFGAKVIYTCSAGYVLSGTPERVCQGDGYWSGQAPTCETHGTPQIGIIDEGKCRDPPVVPFASQDGAPGQRVFPLGTQLTYTCSPGYNIDGFFRAMCVGEGRWVGPRMTCSPRRCGDPGDIQNGHREGNVFVYPNRVTYVCNEGYELVGRPHRTCQASGQWSGQVPTCKPVRCPRLGAPANGHMHGQDFTYGAIIRFSCFRGFRLVGSQARRCQQDGTWSGQTATCAMVDCGIPGPFYNGYLDGQQTTFGAVIIFRCFGPATFDGGPSSTTCQENGQWSNPLPKCWSKCEVPRITNGTAQTHKPGRLLPHESTLSFKCEEGHNINTTDEARCYNGTWSFVPECIPSPCDSERPEEIRNGFVRYHGVRHGDKAKYRCNTGYKLVGDTFMTCSYGKWVGKETPYCDPVYCPYPGTIKNGQILLVGVIGKYEYRPYVRRIGHNEQIEYQCNKGYKRVGPQAATCVDGQWSPDSKPYCVPGQHPRLMYIFRGKRSLRKHGGNLTQEMYKPREVHPGIANREGEVHPGIDTKDETVGDDLENVQQEVDIIDGKVIEASGHAESLVNHVSVPPGAGSVTPEGHWSSGKPESIMNTKVSAQSKLRSKGKMKEDVHSQSAQSSEISEKESNINQEGGIGKFASHSVEGSVHGGKTMVEVR